MKQLLREYLASLKERHELDVLLPDLVSERGWDVYSRPAVGVRQLGVDMAAIGVDDDGVKKIFLFSIKPGNLKRIDWNGTVQALRPSLDEIVDMYVAQRIPQKYKSLPVVICICVGGDIDQSVEADVRAYCDATFKRTAISFQEWTGDKIAGLLLSGALRENVLPQDSRALFRKSIAMLDEPDASYGYFSDLLNKMLAKVQDTPKARLSMLRRINICLMVLFVWAREAKNLEAPYRASELAILRAWPMIVPHLAGKGKIAESLVRAVDNLIQQHLEVATAYVEKIYPHTTKLHALSTAVRSRNPVDINLRLFDALGRLALYGTWMAVIRVRRLDADGTFDAKDLDKRIELCRESLKAMISNNPILFTPVKDDHAIELNLAALFLTQRGDAEFVRYWVEQLSHASIYGYRSGRIYPCILDDYRELASHPKSGDAYRKEVTAGSILYPSLAAWATMLGDGTTLRALSKFTTEHLAHCELQLWVPGPDSEQHIYDNTASHGLALTDLKITDDGLALEQAVGKELKANDALDQLSAVRSGMWPLVLMACRHYRIPVPPHFWTAVANYGERGEPDLSAEKAA